MGDKMLLTVKETVARAEQEGIPVTEYCMRRLLKMGKIPCRVIGKKQIIYWPNVMSYFTCENGCDNGVDGAEW